MSREHYIAHHPTAYSHPEGNSYIERFHRGPKEEVWPSEYQSLEEAGASSQRYVWEYNHGRPPREAFLKVESNLETEALNV